MKEKTTKLATLIIRLANVPDELEGFQEDPEGFLAQTNLEEEAKAALLSRDKESIRAILEEELGQDFLEIPGLPLYAGWGVVAIFILGEDEDQDEDEDEAGD